MIYLRISMHTMLYEYAVYNELMAYYNIYKKCKLALNEDFACLSFILVSQSIELNDSYLRFLIFCIEKTFM